MADLAGHWQYLEGEWRALEAAPLSARKAKLVAALVDAYVDRMSGALEGADILEFRAAMAEQSPALGRVMDFCSGRAQVTIEAVEVPLHDYGGLSLPDFMVSLYNHHRVQRLLLVLADGQRVDMMVVLTEAMATLRLGTPIIPDGAT